MIEVKVKDLLNGLPALTWLMSREHRPAVALRLARLMRCVNLELTDYDKVRIPICEKHGTLDPETNSYVVTPEKRPVFDKALQELAEQKVVLPGEKIDLSDLGEMPLIPAHLFVLDWLFNESDDAPPGES